MIHTGKNLFRLPDSVGDTIVSQGITFSINHSNGEITANGTATGNAFCNFEVPRNIPEGRYIVSGCPNGGGGNIYFVEVDYVNASGSEQWPKSTSSNSNGVVTISGNAYIKGAYISVRSGTTVNNVVFKPMFFRSDETSAKVFQYEPYYLPDVYAAAKRNLYSGSLEQGSLQGTNGEPLNNVNNRVRTLDFISVKPSTAYTISCDGRLKPSVFLFMYGSDKTFKRRVPSSWINVPYGFATNADEYYMKVVFILEGQVNLTPSDIYNIEIVADEVEPQRLYSIYRKSGNLLVGEVKPGTISGTSGKESSSTTDFMTADFCPVKPSTTYIYGISGIARNVWVHQYDSSKTWIRSDIVYSVPFTTASNCAFVRFHRGNTYAGEPWSFNLGSTLLPYVPYLEKVHSIVPDGYQALEYIKSGSSNAYIDSGVMGSKTIKVDDYISYDALHSNALSGGDGVDNNTRFKWGLNANAQLYYGYRYNSNTASVTIGEKYHYHIEDGNQYIESFGGSKLISNTYAAPDGYHPYPISLYAMRAYNKQDIGSYQLDSRHYATRIYDGNALIRDYIPIRTTKETTDYDGNAVAVGTLGLYDKVSGKIFVNKGTGTFTAGPEL